MGRIDPISLGAYAPSYIQSGGERDPVQDDLIAEVIAEEEAGQKFSLQPGQA